MRKGNQQAVAFANGKKPISGKFAFGAALAVAGILVPHQRAAADQLDTVLQRLEALERSNAKLARENAELRGRVQRVEGTKGVAAPVAAAPEGPPKGNPVLHGAVATSPAPPSGGITVGGMPVKAGPLGPILDNTTVTIYGHADVSLDVFNPSVFDQGTKLGIASNTSYFGIRARHNLAPYGYDGFAAVAQFESQVDVASAPTERAAFGTRDSYVGMESPWGAIKGGKSDTPYKKATAPFDPFAGTLGDYNSIMGNTGGDNRAEFDWRMNHAIWYESPIFSGFQFSALFSPGQNYAQDNSDFSFGDLFQCNGASARGSGSNFPGTNGSATGNIGAQSCTDGSFGNAYSAALTYKNGPFTAIAAYERHENVNRHGDDNLEVNVPANAIFLPDGSQILTGVHNEWAAKVGGGYRFDDPLGPLQLYAYYEWLRRDVSAAEEPFNERSRDGVFASATQTIGKWSLSASYIHAFNTPGAPACLSLNNVDAGVACTSPGPIVQIGQFQQNQFNESADQYSIGARYRFNNWASWYVVATQLTQGMGAHYCLGASGHGYQVCSRDAANDTIGGATLKAVTTGFTLDF
jgi:predicted porin